MDLYSKLKCVVVKTIDNLYDGSIDTNSIAIETPKDPTHGELATNAALILAAQLKKSPRTIANELKERLELEDFIAYIEVAGPGFINFTLKPEIWQNTVSSILKIGTKYGDSIIGKNRKVNIEFVSANPTGPMHIGHARGAVYGDALARLLMKAGFDVTKEFYMNDYGSQIDILAKSAYLRYKEVATGVEISIPSGLYPGDYLIPVGRKLYEQHKDRLLELKEEEYLPIIKDFVVSSMMELIKTDLYDLDIKHDVFFSEKDLHKSGAITQAIEELKAKNLIYLGNLEAPKGKASEDWEEREQLLFRSSKYGDDQDRPLQKQNGEWSYFSADIAYIKNKIERGFEHLVMVLGADHGGYIKRFEAAVKAFNENIKLDIKLCQLVNFIKDGESVKMSKRAGNFATVRDVINEVGKDIIRFMMLTRKNDAPMDFDLDKVKEQSKDNPVFYVQYAHVRAKSIIENAGDQLPEAYNKFLHGMYNLDLLSTQEEIHLIKNLASWPKMVESSAVHFEPHRIAFYLQNIAAEFHSLWNLGKENNCYRFLILDNLDLTTARLALAKAVQTIIRSGFEVLGVTPLEKM